MPLLLLLPVLVVCLVLAWLLLTPIALWQRYRVGRARRRAVRWLTVLNAWSLLLSVLVFLGSAWLAGYWIETALTHAAIGLLAGTLVGIVGLALTRFEYTPQGVFYTPNRWLILALTLTIATRIAYGLYRLEQAWVVDRTTTWLSQQGSMLAIGGLLLGHYLAYAWGLRWRVRRP